MAPGEYIKLADVGSQPEKSLINIWACVLGCSGLRPTRGTDLQCSLTLVDPSLDSPPGEALPLELEQLRGGVQVLVFALSADLFPKPQPGDLVRFHRVEVNSFNGRPQLVAKVGPRRPCHFCLFHPQVRADAEPYQRSPATHSPVEGDYLKRLRDYYHEKAAAPQLLAEERGADPAYARRVCELRPRTFSDVICRVLAVENLGTSNPCFYVWDGTDACPLPPGEDNLELAAEGADAELFPEAERRAIVKRYPALEGAGVVPDLPLLGSALPVTLVHPLTRADVAVTDRFRAGPRADGDGLLLPELPPLGVWIKLRNVPVVAVDGQLQALFTRASQWLTWSQSPKAAAEHERRLQENQVAAWAPSEQAGEQEGRQEGLRALWASERRERVPYATLRQVMLEAGSGRSQQYRCLVRLLRHLPERAEEYCRKRTPESAFEFCLKLLLQDATGELDAMLLGEHGSAFFRDCPQRDMSREPAYAASLAECMAVIEDQQPEGGSWLECCVQRAYPDRGAPRTREHARFRVVDTVIII